MSNACVIIPCRYSSTRFNAKPIANLNGKPLMYYPYQASINAKNVDKVFIATDDERIAKVCEDLKMNFVITRNDHYCGTDRVAEAYKKLTEKFDVVVNVQGDEPFIDTEEIEKCVSNMFKNKNFEAINGISPILNPADIVNSGVVKVVIDKSSKILYLSRSPIPYPNAKQIKFNYFRQLGLYAFRSKALEIFENNKPGPLELTESVEILRLLENNFHLYSFESKILGPAIDTSSDLEIANKILFGK